MATSRSASKPLDLDLTIVSAKHLKNVNWRHGDLKPYAVFWIDADRRIATKADDAGNTRPVWNERFTLPLAAPLSDTLLTLEIFHYKPSETPKPLVGTLRIPIKDLLPAAGDAASAASEAPIRTLELRRPSGRPQGKIRLKIAVRERPAPPEYHAPPPGYFPSSAPPPPQLPNAPVRDYREFAPSPYTAPPLPPPPPPSTSPYPYGAYSDPYSYPAGYYPGYYSPPPPPPRPFFDRPPPPPTATYGAPSGPSAPVDYSSYDQRQKSGKMGVGTTLTVGAIAGGIGGIALDEGLRYEEEKISETAESEIGTRDNYSGYRGEF